MRYKIVEISPEDAYFSSKEHLIGIEVEPEDSHPDNKVRRGGWASGSWKYVGSTLISYEYNGEIIAYEPMESMYFYKVNLKKL